MVNHNAADEIKTMLNSMLPCPDCEGSGKMLTIGNCPAMQPCNKCNGKGMRPRADVMAETYDPSDHTEEYA